MKSYLKLGQSDVTSPTNFMCLLHKVCIFQLYLEFVWRNFIFLVKSLLIYDSMSILKKIWEFPRGHLTVTINKYSSKSRFKTWILVAYAHL
jgi:hypothetical protein